MTSNQSTACIVMLRDYIVFGHAVVSEGGAREFTRCFIKRDPFVFFYNSLKW